MASIITEPKVRVSKNSYTSQVTPRMSVAELERILVELDTTDPKQVTEQVVRCNNRCNGNKATVSATKILTSGTGIDAKTETISFDFFVGTPPTLDCKDETEK